MHINFPVPFLMKWLPKQACWLLLECSMLSQILQYSVSHNRQTHKKQLFHRHTTHPMSKVKGAIHYIFIVVVFGVIVVVCYCHGDFVCCTVVVIIGCTSVCPAVCFYHRDFQSKASWQPARHIPAVQQTHIHFGLQQQNQTPNSDMLNIYMTWCVVTWQSQWLKMTVTLTVPVTGNESGSDKLTFLYSTIQASASHASCMVYLR